MPTDDRPTETIRTSSGKPVGTSIQGRALDPTGAVAVQEKMRTTDLGALARAAAAKKAQTAGGSAGKDVQKRALAPEEKGESKRTVESKEKY